MWFAIAVLIDIHWHILAFRSFPPLNFGSTSATVGVVVEHVSCLLHFFDRGRERHSLIFRQHLSGYVHKQSREENSRDESTAEPEPAHLLLLLAGSQRPLGGFGSGQHF